MKSKIQSGIIIVLIIIIGIGVFFGTKAVKRYVKEIDALKYENTALELKITQRDVQIKFEEAKVKNLDRKVDSLNKVFVVKDKIIAGITADLNKALSQLNGITSDSSYIFLQKIAYAFPGTLQYLFNSTQIKYIHSDYLTARTSEKLIPAYQSQIATCKVNLTTRDSIEMGLKKVIDLQKFNLADCKQMNDNKDTIIKDTEKQREAEARRKRFWRNVSIGTSAIAVLFKFGIL
jgi:hypothetical protein